MSVSSRCLHRVCEHIGHFDIVAVDIAIVSTIAVAVTLAISVDCAIATTLAIDMVHCVCSTTHTPHDRARVRHFDLDEYSAGEEEDAI